MDAALIETTIKPWLPLHMPANILIAGESGAGSLLYSTTRNFDRTFLV